MKSLRISLTVALTLSFALLYATTLRAATVTVTKHPFSRILVEGPIVKGDYERLLESIVAAGVDVDTVFLATGGGDAVEAMRMGRMIRAFGLGVETALRSPERNICLPIVKSQTNCRCDSACLLLYLAGVKRYGDAIGAHRIYLNYEAPRKLSLDESKAVSKAIEMETRKYFDEMGAPPSLLELVNSATSDRVKNIPPDYVESSLYGYAKDYEEWLIARCGSASGAFLRLRRSWAAGAGGSASSDYATVIECFRYSLRAERLKKFRSVLLSALELVDAQSIKPVSLLASTKSAMSAELPDIIGKPKDVAMRQLATFGIGLVDHSSLTNGEGYNLRKTLIVSIAQSGLISSVDFWPNAAIGDDLHPYTGFIVSGLSQASSPDVVVAKLGKPWRQRLTPGQTNVLWFDGEKYDLQLTFDLPDNRLRSVRFNTAGYWKSLAR